MSNNKSGTITTQESENGKDVQIDPMRRNISYMGQEGDAAAPF